MALTTERLELILPEAYDKVDISVISNNFSKIDASAILKKDIANNLTTDQEGMVLDARQGKALSDKITQLSTSASGALTPASIANDLKTNDTSKVLSAAQGAALENKKAEKPVVYSFTLGSNRWSSSAPYTQEVAVAGVLASDIPFLYVDMSGVSSVDSGVELREAWMYVDRIVVGSGKFTAYCYEDKPSADVPVNAVITR